MCPVQEVIAKHTHAEPLRQSVVPVKTRCKAHTPVETSTCCSMPRAACYKQPLKHHETRTAASGRLGHCDADCSMPLMLSLNKGHQESAQAHCREQVLAPSVCADCSVPGASRSGFRRPSCVGPLELKSARLS